jgi:pyruvate dehydrogenase E1 component alpha subunit
MIDNVHILPDLPTNPQVTDAYPLPSMSDPGTTYRTREEIQQMRSEKDAIAGLKKYILDWNVTDEASLKAIVDKAKKDVATAVEEAKASPFPDTKDFWTDIYVSPPPTLSDPPSYGVVMCTG